MNDWEPLFENIKKKDYAKKLHKFLDEEYSNHIIYPPRNLLFNACSLTPL